MNPHTITRTSAFGTKMRSMSLFGVGAILISVLTIISSQTVLAEGATLFLSPSSNSYTIGKTFPILVKVHTGGVAINAGEASLNFPTDLLEVTGLSKSGSIFSLWTNEPTYSNTYGTINFGGGILGSNYSGSSGKILTINFRAKKEGQASVNFSNARILAADGKGTNILDNTEGGIYTLEEYIPPAAPVVSSSTHPDPDKWYSNNDPEFSWELPSDVTGVSPLLHENPIGDPGPISDGLISSKKFEDVKDGIWYFHIKFRNKYSWSEIIHRKVLIDTEAPEPFEIKVDNEGNPTNPTHILIFESKDSLSGIDHYEVKIDQEIEKVEPRDFKAELYRSSSLTPGKHTVIVKAVDKAGNSISISKEIIIEPETAPSGFKIFGVLISYSTAMITLLVIIGVVVLIIIYQWYRFSMQKKKRGV